MEQDLKPIFRAAAKYIDGARHDRRQSVWLRHREHRIIDLDVDLEEMTDPEEPGSMTGSLAPDPVTSAHFPIRSLLLRTLARHPAAAEGAGSTKNRFLCCSTRGSLFGREGNPPFQ